MRTIVKGSTYRHFKGALYFVEDVAEHTETGEQMVIYRNREMKLYARPIDMFMSPVDKVKYPDVEQEYRFELVKGNYTY